MYADYLPDRALSSHCQPALASEELAKAKVHHHATAWPSQIVG